ncbi:serine/threonine-protein kinase [Acrasis kona]|uniref:protein-tyrosine-phosphatase n=1 Tax=Acrasis kona TaxID=1008807 RepID=A0AAW2ZGT9_9EUKA
MDILVYILIRDPLRRPSIQDILQRFNHTWIKAVPQYEKTSVVGVGAGAQENVSIVAVQASEPDYSLPLETPHVVTPVKVNKIHFTSPGAGVLQGGQPMPLQPYPWTKNDTLFYVHKATFVVRNRLYIVSDELANNKSVLNQLGITHVVNCCVGGGNNNQNLLQSNFFYFGMSHSISENSVSAYNEYVRAFEFVRDAIRKRGRVLVYSGKGLSRSGLFVVLYLMNTFNISSYESYLFVKDRRPALRPEILSHFLHFLLRVRKQQQQKNKLLAELQQVGKLKDESAEGSEGLGVDQQPLHSHKKISKINKKIALLLVQHSLKPASPIDANDVSGLLANKRVGRAQSVRVPLPVVPNQTPQKRTKSQHAVDSVSDHGIHWYRCLCGACVVGVVSPFDPIRLHAGNMTFENSPMRSWPGFLQEMRLLYFYDTKYLHMGLTNKDKVLLDPFDVNKHTEVYTEGIPPTPSRKNSGRSSAGSRSGRRGSSRGEVSDEDDDDSDDDEEEIQWIINKCKYCSYMVYARKKEKKVVTKKNLVKDNKATHFSQPPSGGGNVVDQNGRRESLTLHLSGIRENRQGQLRTASAIPAASLQLWSDNGLSNSATPNGEPINEDDLFKSTIKYDIAINTSIKTTQIVTNSNVNGIQDLRPQMFFKGCQ